MTMNIAKGSFNNKQLVHFKDKSVNLSLPTGLPATSTIISTNCNGVIHNITFTHNKCTLYIYIYIKILYYSKNSTNLSVFQYKFPMIETIPLPPKIDGLYIKHLDIKNRLSLTIDIEDFQITNSPYPNINIYFLLLTKSKLLLLPSILYFDTNNIYSSDSLGENLSYLKITTNNYCDFCFSSFSDSIYYRDALSIYEYSLSLNSIVNSFNVNNIQWFSNLTRSEFIISIKDDLQSKIIKMDYIHNYKDTIYVTANNISLEKFKLYDSVLSFLQIENQKEILVILNISGDILYFQDFKGIDFHIFIDKNLLLIDTGENLKIIDLTNLTCSDISYPLENFKILQTEPFNDSIIILGLANDTHYIFYLDIKTLLYKELFKTINLVSSIGITSLNEIIFSCNDLGLFNVYSIDSFHNVKLCLKLFVKSLYIKCRK